MTHIELFNELKNKAKTSPQQLLRSMSLTHPSNLLHRPAVLRHFLCSFMRHPSTCLNTSEVAVKKMADVHIMYSSLKAGLSENKCMQMHAQR